MNDLVQDLWRRLISNPILIIAVAGFVLEATRDATTWQDFWPLLAGAIGRQLVTPVKDYRQ